MAADIDNERHARIQAYGIPPAIPEWDGWRHPSDEDIRIIRAQIANRAQRLPSDEDPRLVSGWTLVGDDGIFPYLSHRPESEVRRYREDHPVQLPSFPSLDTPSQLEVPGATVSGPPSDSANVPSAGPGPMEVEESAGSLPAPQTQERGGETSDDPLQS